MIEWETIVYGKDGSYLTRRLKVFNGWIVRHGGLHEYSMVFVPDKNHEWII